MTFDLVIRGGRVFGPGDWGVVDVGVRDGRVAVLGQLGSAPAARVVDARGLVILPGLVDPHTHIAMPLAGGMATCDDFLTGTVAAARGGITTLSDFVQPRPGQSPGEALRERLAQATGRAVVDYTFSMTLASADAGTLGELPCLVEQGVRSFKMYTINPGLMLDDRSLLTCLRAIARTGALATVHAESAGMVGELMQGEGTAGRRGVAWFPRTRPPLAEAEAVGRVLVLARLAGARLCIRHLSSAEGVAAVRAARRGVPVWVETAPQYLCLDESVYGREDGHRFIMTPPLRCREDREALWRALREGTVHFLGTDHCALSVAQKDGAGEWARVPGGVPGLETCLPLVYTLGVRTGRIGLARLAEVTSTCAARAFDLFPRKGTLLPGADADLVLMDPATVRRVDVGEGGLGGLLGWSPYEGWRLAGWPRLVVSRGEVIVAEGEFCGRAGRGRYLGPSGEAWSVDTTRGRPGKTDAGPARESVTPQTVGGGTTPCW
ncbi:MAG: amidohydrolase family protein [Bacillota bacterium]|nr:amidohydrolase family protein [Bacillota bacterium]